MPPAALRRSTEGSRWRSVNAWGVTIIRFSTFLGPTIQPSRASWPQLADARLGGVVAELSYMDTAPVLRDCALPRLATGTPIVSLAVLREVQASIVEYEGSSCLRIGLVSVACRSDRNRAVEEIGPTPVCGEAEQRTDAVHACPLATHAIPRTTSPSTRHLQEPLVSCVSNAAVSRGSCR
jgi:hypothetical protein